MATTIDRIGRSGEFAVASQLALISDTVSLVPHNSYADIIFEYQRSLYKVQVKTSSKERKYPHKDGDYRIGWTFLLCIVCRIIQLYLLHLKMLQLNTLVQMRILQKMTLEQV